MSGAARPAERGVALVVVLWALALLSAVLLGFAATTRTETALARNLLENTRGRHLAEAGVELAAQALLDPAARRALRVDGVPVEMRIDGEPVIVSIQDEAGKIDLNLAPPELLAGLFVHGGLARNAAEALAAAVVDFRDDDEARGLGGAESSDYQAAGRADRPKNGPFDSIVELQQVLGMPPGLWRQVAPLVTVHGMQPGVDTAVAPAAVLAALPGAVSGSDADRRPPAYAAAASAPPADPALGRWFNPSPGIAYGVAVQVPGQGGARREAVLWIGQRAEQPFTVVAWR